MDDRERAEPPDENGEGQSSELPEPPPLARDTECAVDSRTVKIGRMIGCPVVALVSLFPLTLFTIGWATGGIPNRVYFVLLAILLTLLFFAMLLAYKWPALRHKHLRYLVHDDGLRIRRGVLWRKVIWIPITRVQHTDFSQGPVQRKFDLATLTVHTAGTSGASISLAGLEYQTASRLCDHLRPTPAADGE